MLPFISGLIATALIAPVPRCPAVSMGAAADSTVHLYSLLESKLRRARETASPRAQSFAHSLSQRWLSMSPAELVEATLVSGTTMLEGFDEGLELLFEAEEGAELMLGGRAYGALMRLGQAESRPSDVLALLARARSRGVERSDTALLNAMGAAGELGDWGAVARLYAELSVGEEAAAEEASELEVFALGPPGVLDGMRAAYRPASASETKAGVQIAEAYSLALRAHCERKDVGRAIEVVGRMRDRDVPLKMDEYRRLADLARASAKPLDVLAALSPLDAARSLGQGVERPLLKLKSTVGLAGSSLGRVERLAFLVLVWVTVFDLGLAYTQEFAPEALPAELRRAPLDEAAALRPEPMDASGLFPADIFAAAPGTDPFGF